MHPTKPCCFRLLCLESVQVCDCWLQDQALGSAMFLSAAQVCEAPCKAACLFVVVSYGQHAAVALRCLCQRTQQAAVIYVAAAAALLLLEAKTAEWMNVHGNCKLSLPEQTQVASKSSQKSSSFEKLQVRIEISAWSIDSSLTLCS